MSEPDHYDILMAELELRLTSAKTYSDLMQESPQKAAVRAARVRADVLMPRGVCDNHGEAIDRIAERNAADRAALLTYESKREET